MLTFLMACVIVGAVAGLLMGLLGAGPGMVMVPALVFLLPYYDISHEVAMHIALATSLSVITVTSIRSVLSHHRHQNIDWQLFRRIAAGVVAGGLAGAILAHFISGHVLRILFGVFALYMAVKMFFQFHSYEQKSLPTQPLLNSLTAIMTTLASLLGITGGAFLVPFFHYCGIAVRYAIGTAMACSLLLAMVAVLAYIVTGAQAENLPAWSIGYVYLPAFLSLSIAGMIMVPIGARWSAHAPAKLLKRIFAVVLLVAGIEMLLGA